MKPDEIPATTTEYWEGKKMRGRKKKVEPEPEQEEESQDMNDPQAMESMLALRGDPNLRPMGRGTRTMRKEKGRRGDKLRQMG